MYVRMGIITSRDTAASRFPIFMGHRITSTHIPASTSSMAAVGAADGATAAFTAAADFTVVGAAAVGMAAVVTAKFHSLCPKVVGSRGPPLFDLNRQNPFNSRSRTESHGRPDSAGLAPAHCFRGTDRARGPRTRRTLHIRTNDDGSG